MQETQDTKQALLLHPSLLTKRIQNWMGKFFLFFTKPSCQQGFYVELLKKILWSVEKRLWDGKKETGRSLFSSP